MTVAKTANKRRTTRRTATKRSTQGLAKKLRPDVDSRGAYNAFGYQSVRTSNREGRVASGGSGELHYKYDRAQLLNQSREFMRINAIYQGMIERAVAYIVGNGFKLQATTKNKAFNAKVEKLWKDYWKRPEIKQILSGSGTEQMIAQELLTCGDTGVLLTNNKGLVQLIEAEQIAGPKSNDDGIKKNRYGAPTEYYIASYGKAGSLNVAKGRPVAPDDFLFITRPCRSSAIRGVPPCQASFPMLHRINDVCDSEAIAWQLLARFAVSINKKAAATIGQAISKPDPNKTGSAAEGQLSSRVTELDYALMFFGEDDEEIKGIDRNIPGKDFSASLRMFLRLLGLPLGLPLEIILLDWTESNYSQSRAVLEQANQTFLRWQFLIEDFFHRRVYPWKVQGWIEKEGLPDRADKFDHEWTKPTFPWIDQLKEALAQGKKLDRSLTTHAQVCKSQNLDRDNVVATRDVEVRDAIQRAQKIKKDTGVEVPWEIFAGLEYKPAPVAAPVQDKKNASGK